MLKFCSALCVLSLCLVLPLAHADTVYNSPASFAAAAPSTTTVPFVVGSGSYIFEGTSSFSVGPVSFSTPNGSDMFLINPGYYASSYGSNFLSVDYSTDTLTITFPSSTAVAFDIGGLYSGITVPLILSDGFSDSITAPGSISGGALDFFGVTTTTPITSLTLDLPDFPNYNALANFTYGTGVSATPEPSSLILMATGLAGAAGAIRRKLRS